MRQLMSFLSTRRNDDLLDIGTGNGNFLKILSSLYEGTGKVVGIDNLEIAIQTCKKLFKDEERYEFYQMDAENLTFEDESFGIVTLSNSLHHLNNPEAIFKEMERVLEKYGIIIINEMIKDGLNKRQKAHLKIHHFAAEIDRATGSFHNETYTGQEILTKLKDLSSLEIKLVFEHNNARLKSNDPEEIEWLLGTIDKLLKKVEDHDNYSYFEKKGKRIKKYISKNGFQSATQLLVVLG